MTNTTQNTRATGSSATTIGSSADNSSADEQLVVSIRLELEHSCAAMDANTQSRLNSIRHAVLERKAAPRQRTLLPFGGLITACVLVLSVSLLSTGPASETASPAASPPLEDIEILTSSDSLDLFEDYEFYRWLAENGSSI